MIVVTVSISFLNEMEIHLVQNRKENCHNDHMPFNLKRNGILVFSAYSSVFMPNEDSFYLLYIIRSNFRRLLKKKINWTHFRSYRTLSLSQSWTRIPYKSWNETLQQWIHAEWWQFLLLLLSYMSQTCGLGWLLLLNPLSHELNSLKKEIINSITYK